MDFYTKSYLVRQMVISEIKELEVGEEISICIKNNIPKKMEFINTKVIKLLFWNCDKSMWGLETTNGFVDTYSIYEFRER